MEDESEGAAERVAEGDPDSVAVSVLFIVADVEGDVVYVDSLVCEADILDERVVREVAVPERLRTADRVSLVEPDAVLEFEEVAVTEPEGDPDTVSATDDVAERVWATDRVSTAVPDAVRVVLIEREVVPDAVGETVPIEDTVAVVEGDPETVGATVPDADSVVIPVPEAERLTVLVGVPVDERVPTADRVASAEPVVVRLAVMDPVCERVPTADIDGEEELEGDRVLVTEWLEELVVVAVRLAEIEPVADTETSAVRVAETDPVAELVATVVPVARDDSVA